MTNNVQAWLIHNGVEYFTGALKAPTNPKILNLKKL